MKKLYIMGLLAGSLFITACSDHDSDKPDAFESETFSGLNELTLNYNGTGMAGKSVSVAPAGDSKALVSFFSEIDLDEVNEMFDHIPEFPGPGVLPGSPKVDITVPVTFSNGRHQFSYQGETDFVTYSVDASFIDDESMTCNFTNVKLKDLTFAGTAWKPVAASTDVLSDNQPFHIVWDTSAPVQIPGLGTGLQDILRVLVNLPCIPVYNNTAEMSLTQVIANSLRTVGMTEDGAMPVTYLQTANGASVFTQAPKYTFMYVPLSPNAIRLYANPTDLLSLVLLNNTNRDPNIPANPFGKPGRALEQGTLLQLIQQLVTTAAPMVSQGLPMACVRQGDNMSLYVSTEVLLPLLKNVIVPILANPAMRGIVLDYVSHNAKLSQYAAVIMGLYDALPTILDQTTRIELGLNFTKA